MCVMLKLVAGVVFGVGGQHTTMCGMVASAIRAEDHDDDERSGIQMQTAMVMFSIRLLVWWKY